MGRIRAGISSFLTELLDRPDKADLEMLSNVHWNIGVSDFLFTDFADALLEAFRTWGSRGDSNMGEIQACLEKLRLPITAGHRARLAAAQTDRTFWEGSVDGAMEAVFFGEQPLFQQDIGAVCLFCENVRQVLAEIGMEEHDAKDIQVLMEHYGELVLNRVRNAKLVQPPSMAHDVHCLKQQHQLFRISDYHFDVFLDHVRRALKGEDPEAADLAPAQLEIRNALAAAAASDNLEDIQFSSERLQAAHSQYEMEPEHFEMWKWYHFISEEPSINAFFTGQRPQVMMFQTRFWKKVLREGLHRDGRRQLRLIQIHQHLRITHQHFDAFVRCLINACEALSLSQDSSNKMRAAVECFRPQVVKDYT
eukprot:g12387.t1